MIGAAAPPLCSTPSPAEDAEQEPGKGRPVIGIALTVITPMVGDPRSPMMMNGGHMPSPWVSVCVSVCVPDRPRLHGIRRPLLIAIGGLLNLALNVAALDGPQ